MQEPDRRSRGGISVLQGAAFIVGIVIGIGIFKSPQLVAQNVANETTFIALWIAGGLVTLIGALVYAEMASAHPSAGGEYHFLSRALGRPVGLLFAWARITVIQTGAIAAVAFVYGDYAQQLLPLGVWGPAIHAVIALAALTTVNLAGVTGGKGFQLLLTGMTMTAVAAVVAAGLTMTHSPAPANLSGGSALGLAMIFVLLTYGGWNEGIRQSSAVGASAIRAVSGPYGATALAIVVCCAALSTLNGTIFTGARLYRAVGNDLPLLNRLGRGRGDNPTAAILAQSTIAIALVGFGALTRDGFESMVEYTAPVFWLFLLLVGLSSFVLRRAKPERDEPFRAPFYPLTPALFCLTCAYLLYSSLVDTGLGALIGITVLLIGVPLVWLAMPRARLERP
ncbi:MAG: amino acid permease [Hyphomicrobiales bacterium]|nr:amino acid permease [Hyphomicrobiales bacterium]